MTRQHTGLFSSTLLPFENGMCLWAVIPVAGGVCGSYQHNFVSRVLRGQFLAGTLHSQSRIAGRRGGRTCRFQQGDGGCGGSLWGSGRQRHASALDRNTCPNSQEVTISTSLQHGPAQGKILSLVETVACGRLCSCVGAGILLTHPLCIVPACPLSDPA